MNRPLALLIIGLFAFPYFSFGQSMVQNQRKYWDYREKALNGYISVGEGQGKSIPSGGKDDEANFITWGDATINLGWYMAILATEYHLSKKRAFVRTEAENVIQKEQTIQELFYALKALDRLDMNAEPYFDPAAEPALNGFFMRDDVPEALTKDFKSKKHMKSDFESPKISDNEMSQDQVYHLLMGLVCVHRFIPEATKYKGMAISDHARQTAIRLIDWLRLNGWAVVNPAELDSKGRPTKVERGWEAYIFSAGTLKILEKLIPNDKKYKKYLNPLNSVFWSSLRMGVNPTYVKDDNSHMAMVISAAGNGFRKVTYRKLAKKSFRHDWYVYPLVNLAIYPENCRYRKDEELMKNTRSMLDSAPADGIEAPYPNVSESGWSVNIRFLRKKESLYSPPEYTKGREFAGYDYMLLHNLFLIHENQLLLDKTEERN